MPDYGDDRGFRSRGVPEFSIDTLPRGGWTPDLGDVYRGFRNRDITTVPEGYRAPDEYGRMRPTVNPYAARIDNNPMRGANIGGGWNQYEGGPRRFQPMPYSRVQPMPYQLFGGGPGRRGGGGGGGDPFDPSRLEGYDPFNNQIYTDPFDPRRLGLEEEKFDPFDPDNLGMDSGEYLSSKYGGPNPFPLGEGLPPFSPGPFNPGTPEFDVAGGPRVKPLTVETPELDLLDMMQDETFDPDFNQDEYYSDGWDTADVGDEYRRWNSIRRKYGADVADRMMGGNVAVNRGGIMGLI